VDPDRIGPFQVEEVLGHGGAGVVYRATDTRSGRRLALKLVPPELADRRRLRRLRREAEVLRRIDHPAIARLLGVETVDGRTLLALEHIPGEDLRSRLGRGPLPVGELLRVAATLAEGLAVAHAAAVVHRDLKPENVILGGPLGATILDFGLAKLLDPDRGTETTLTVPGDLPGTLGAMSPEQVTGAVVDHRSDLFSLGILMYEMASGRHPFRAPTPPETVHRICYHEPPPVVAPEGGLPPPVVELVHRLLAKKPRRRPPSAAAVAAELAAVLGVAAPDLPPPAPAPQRGLRARAMMAAAWLRGLPRRG